MGFVVDASLIIASLVPEVDTDAARLVMVDVQKAGAIAPPHLALEVANALTMKVRRKLIDSVYRDAALETFIAYEVGPDPESDRAAVVRRAVMLADAHALTLYDAAYLELARRRSLVLGTLDGPLRDPAILEGVAVQPA